MENGYKFDIVQTFFDEICTDIGVLPYKIIMVSHILPDKPHFINAINRICKVELIIPKPKSINTEVLKKLENQGFNIKLLTRSDVAHISKITSIIKDAIGDSSFIVMDIGGYFATDNLDEIKRVFGNQFMGIIEDTENGHQKYQKIQSLPVHVISVARSALKDPEDFLVGQSIVFSAEIVMREINELMIGKKALVIGYGKVGASIAQTLVNRNISVSVFDIDPAKRLRAFSQGFPIPDRKHAIRDVDVIFSATGNQSLTQYDLDNLKKGCIIFSATSSDDEFGINHTMHQFKVQIVSENVKQYYRDEFYFYLANDGNAVNFIHGAKVGKFIHLVQAEMMYAVASFKSNLTDKKAISGVSKDIKKEIALTWIKHFNYSNLD